MTPATVAGALRHVMLRVLHASASRCAVSSFGLFIQLCADCGLFHHGRQLHARFVLLSVIPVNFLGSKLISLYSRNGRLEDARLIFDAIPIKNLFSWKAMLLAYSVHEQTVAFLRLFSSFPLSIRPDVFTLSSLLNCICTAAKKIQSFALRLGHDSDLFISNDLITAYLRNSNLKSARKVFDKMHSRDIVSWNSIISGLSQEGHYSACIQLYHELELGNDGVKPNEIMVASVLQACSQLKELVFGISVHQFAVESGMVVDGAVCNQSLAYILGVGA